MQKFSLVYNNLFVFLEPVDEPRPTYDCGQLMQGRSSKRDFVPSINMQLIMYFGIFVTVTLENVKV